MPSPLSEKTSEKDEFAWTGEMQESFNKLQAAFTSSPIFAYPDFAKYFIVATYASSTAIIAVLSQKDDYVRENCIQYASRGLNNAERNYLTYE